MPSSGFAISVTNVTAGIGLKLVHGYAYAEVDRFNTSLITSTSGVLTRDAGLHARTSRIDALTDSYYGSFVPVRRSRRDGHWLRPGHGW